MLIGKCPKCNAVYRGWALKSPWYQVCDRCGMEIEIKDYKGCYKLDNLENLIINNLQVHSN